MNEGDEEKPGAFVSFVGSLRKNPTMKRMLGSALGMALASCALQGCLASTVVLRVKPDGSGTAVATLQVNRAAVQDFERVLGAPMGPEKLEDRYPQPDNSALEKFFGTRVTLVNSTLTPTADGFARETTVAFDDVTKIQLPCPLFVDSMTPGHGFSSSSFGSPLITFATRPHENGDRLLIVRMPDDPIDQRPEPRPDPHPLTAAEQQEQALLKRAARGGAIHLFVELETTLLRTNAPARDGNRATILDVDFAKLLNGPAFEDTVAMPSPLSVQELLWRLGDLPGALTPVEREVFLEFEPPTQSTPAPSQSPSRPAAPDTEIFLAPLTVSGQHIAVGQPVNISNSPGYDNQPSFTPDGQGLLFTSARGGAQTDIYRYDLASKQVTQVTNTPESEARQRSRRITGCRWYGSRPTAPSGCGGSRAMAATRACCWRTSSLWATTPGRTTTPWRSTSSDSRARIRRRRCRLPTCERTACDRLPPTSAGRCCRFLGGHTISFVQRSVHGEKTTLSIKELDPATGAIRALTPAVEGTTEVNAAWTADATLLTIQTDHLFAWRRGGDGWIMSPPWIAWACEGRRASRSALIRSGSPSSRRRNSDPLGFAIGSAIPSRFIIFASPCRLTPS